MTLLFDNRTKCGLCGLSLSSGPATFAFPAFLANAEDPLFRFSDAAFHESCLVRDGDGSRAMARYREWREKTGPGNRKCAVCGEQILNPDDYYLIDYLCATEDHEVGRFNFTHLHRSHAGAWPQLEKAIHLLGRASAEGKVAPVYANQIATELRSFVGSGSS